MGGWALPRDLPQFDPGILREHGAGDSVNAGRSRSAQARVPGELGNQPVQGRAGIPAKRHARTGECGEPADARESLPDPELKVRTVLDRAAATIGGRFAGEPLVEAPIRQTIGESYFEIGLFSQARPHLERAIELRCAALGADDGETFVAMRSLGDLLFGDGKWTEAERYLVSAMEGLGKTNGPDDAETLKAMADVGNLYNQLNKQSEAETLLSRAVDGLRRTRGDQDVLTLRTADNLAMVYLSQNKRAQAERLEQDVVRSLQSTLGIENPYSLIATAQSRLDSQRGHTRGGYRGRFEKRPPGPSSDPSAANHPESLQTGILIGSITCIYVTWTR